MAEQIKLSEGTIKYYIANILTAAGCKNRIEFIARFKDLME
jgi:DNA-binding NarL/FixJ family response regulator